MNEVYIGLYDIVERNMEAAGGKLNYPREVIAYTAEKECGYLDVSQIKDMDKVSFIQTVFVMLLNRTVEDKTLDNWKQMNFRDKESYCSAAVRSVASSQEFVSKGNCVLNNIYSTHTEVNKKLDIVPSEAVMSQNAVNRVAGKLYAIYKKMPSFIKKLIKKMFGV